MLLLSIDVTGFAHWALMVLVALWVVWVYRRLVRLRAEVDHAFEAVADAMARHLALVEPLTQSGAARVTLECDTLEAAHGAALGARAALERARAVPSDVDRILALGAADDMLARLLARALQVIDAYPALRNDPWMHDTRAELAACQRLVQQARQRYNQAVDGFNDAAQPFPIVLIARLGGFGAAAPLDALAEPPPPPHPA